MKLCTAISTLILTTSISTITSHAAGADHDNDKHIHHQTIRGAGTKRRDQSSSTSTTKGKDSIPDASSHTKSKIELIKKKKKKQGVGGSTVVEKETPIITPSTKTKIEMIKNKKEKKEKVGRRAEVSNSCVDKPGWVDSYGDDCTWYEAYDLSGCPYYGEYYDGGQGTPNEGCCYCGGGTEVSSPVFSVDMIASADAPLAPESLKMMSAPVVIPVLKWKDYTIWAYSFIDNRNAFQLIMFDADNMIISQWYKPGARYLEDIALDTAAGSVDFIGQSEYKVTLTFEEIEDSLFNNGPIERDNVPSVAPSMAPSAAPSLGANCADKVGWVDSFGDDCTWYEQYESLGCPLYGDYYDGGLGTPNEACCHCVGGDDL
jgi:hypothetical protein